MKVWHISDWETHYEVDEKGHPWVPGAKQRTKPLTYVRWHVYGPNGDNLRYLEASSGVSGKFGEDRWPVAFALFGKLLEVAGRQERGFRGFILGRGHLPATPGILRALTCFSDAQLAKGFEALSDPVCGWIEEVEIDTLPELPATPQSLLEPNRTKPNRTKQKNLTEPNGADAGSDSAQEEDQPPDDSGNSSLPSSESEIGKAAAEEASEDPEGDAGDEPVSAIVPATAAQVLCVLLDLPAGDPKFVDGNLACFRAAMKAANEIVDPCKLLTEAKAKAAEIARDRCVMPRDRPKVLTTWLKGRLPNWKKRAKD